MDKFKSYHKAVEFLEGLVNLPRDKDYMSSRGDAWIHLEKTRMLLDLAGNPEKKFKYVHVTGTSGKGTVATLIHSALVAAGKKAGLFTSPFATTTIEKFKTGDLYISPQEFAELAETLKPAIDKVNARSPWGPLSYFEIIFVLALLYFKNRCCEWAVLEVGCGGRFDATNIIPAPAAAVLTNVGYDHTEILGKTLKKIALEKAGIIKKESVFFTGEQRPHLLQIFKDMCKKEGAEFNLVRQEQDGYAALNRKLASEVCRRLGIGDNEIETGFKKFFLPCRFEQVQKNPLVILDGAHNEDKIKSTLYNLRMLKYGKLHLVLALANNKDIPCILKLAAPVADRIYFTRFEMTHRKCADPAALCHFAGKIKKPGAAMEIFYDPNQALAQALRRADKNDAILVTGSFFLAGRLREHWHPENQILQNRQSR